MSWGRMRCLDEDTAALVLSQALSEEARAIVDAHVDTCPDCFALLASLAESLTPPNLPTPAGTTDGGAADAGPVQVLKRGTTVGRYVLLARVGAGGMGTVYAAEDPALGRTVALKLVRATLRSESENRNLLAEARMMAQLSHRNVVPVYDVGSHENFVFLAMELIDGENLRSWLHEKKRTWREVQRVFLEAGRGLSAAHEAGLVHRDFKPDNVLVGKDGRVVVTDFGLAHSALAPSDRVAGTPAYMAPEQSAGNPADARSDQFSFCVALYEGLVGELPSAKKQGATHVRVPTWLGRIIARGLSPEPDERFASMTALLDALAYEPRARWRRAAIAASVFLVMAVAMFANYRVLHRGHACAEAAAPKLVGAWDSERKQVVHRAFTATGRPSAEGAWQSVERALDAYAAGWTAMHVEACDATFVRRDQSTELFDLRVACLSERLAELRATTTLFALADGRVVDNAPLAAQSLTPIASCGDARALRAITPPRPTIAAQVGALRRELARAKAMRDGGKLSDALVLLKRVADESNSTGYGPVESLALLQLGDVQLASGDAAEADVTLARAARLADTARDDATRARALTRQLYAVGYLLQQFDRVASLDAQTSSVIERLGGDDELEADRLQAVGMTFLAEHDLPGAMDRLSRAIALREKVFGPRGRRVAMSRHSRCLVLIEQKNWQAALPECNLALDIWRDALGPNHPDVSLALKNVGWILFKLGRVDEGCRDIEEALAIEEAALPGDHPTIAGTLLSLGECHASRGDDAVALQLDLRALEILEKRLGPTHPKTGEALASVGGAYMALRDTERAKPFLERALALGREKATPASHGHP